MLLLWKLVWCPKSDTITSDSEEINGKEANRSLFSSELCQRPMNTEWNLNSNWGFRIYILMGIFPEPGREKLRMLSPGLLLKQSWGRWIWQAISQLSIVYRFIWGGGKEIKQIWMEFRILIWKSKVFDVSRIWFLIWIVILLSRLLFLIFHYFLPVWKSVVIWLGEKLGGKKSRKKVVMSAEMQGSVKQLVWKRINHLSWN